MIAPVLLAKANALGVVLLTSATVTWNLGNGSVTLPETLPLHLQGSNNNSNNNVGVRLKHPTLIGSGGGGAVFAFDDDDDSNNELIKVSWSQSAASVRRECQVLQQLEDRGVASITRCRGIFPYDDHDNNRSDHRVMIAIEPYVRNAVAQVNDIPTKALRAQAVRQIAQTLVQMLAARAITVDVQPLMDPTTGDVTFIDFTEAKLLEETDDDDELAIINAFCTEMWTLIPEEWVGVARDAVVEELARLDGMGRTLSRPAWVVLQDQTGIGED